MTAFCKMQQAIQDLQAARSALYNYACLSHSVGLTGVAEQLAEIDKQLSDAIKATEAAKQEWFNEITEDIREEQKSYRALMDKQK